MLRILLVALALVGRTISALLILPIALVALLVLLPIMLMLIVRLLPRRLTTRVLLVGVVLTLLVTHDVTPYKLTTRKNSRRVVRTPCPIRVA
jgi:hypothetical protein